MRISPVTPDDFSASVIAVPPLARNADLRINANQNIRLIEHLARGGVSTLLYGGNANLYHMQPSEYPSFLEMLCEVAPEDARVIPSVGPAYGTMMDQARVLRQFEFPTAMVLPQTGMTTPGGVETGVRRFVETFERPALLYIKQDGFITAEGVQRLGRDGLLSGIKYAVVREDPSQDDYLRRLTELVDPRSIISGMGEQPAIVHMRDFQLGGFTSGCVCVAPRLSMEMLRSIQGGDFEAAESIRALFRPLEDLRNDLHPVRVLHEAVALGGIAETGPMLPLLSRLSEKHQPPVKEAALRLLQSNS